MLVIEVAMVVLELVFLFVGMVATEKVLRRVKQAAWQKRETDCSTFIQIIGQDFF